MTDPTYDSDHVSRGVARLIDRYRKPRTSALLESWLAEVQEVEDALWQLLVERSLETAVGDQLDVLGRIVGQPREGRDDETYRLWISARQMVLRSSGTTTQLLAIARKLVGATGVVRLEEYFPAAFVIRLEASIRLSIGYQIAYMLRQAKPAGVLFQMTWPDIGGSSFRFAPADVPVPDSPRGFDAGAFAAVSDGSTIPVESFPAGMLVIDGVPIVIDGVPLVITPPLTATATTALARLAPPISVARSTRVVPRPAALVPAPRAGTTIELEDAFADASLEMDATGQLFRVGLDLQGAIAALRFAFTLRTTSVAGTDFEEIGVMRFDAAPFDGAVTLVAELEVSAVGQVAELQLYNLSASAAVVTLSSSATVTTKVTSALTLPLGEQLYSVRLRRVGGDAAQRASCRGVSFEGT
jgi:hypothetical protein